MVRQIGTVSNSIRMVLNMGCGGGGGDFSYSAPKARESYIMRISDLVESIMKVAINTYTHYRNKKSNFRIAARYGVL